MSPLNLLSLKAWSDSDDGLVLVKKLMEYGLLASEGRKTCIRGHRMVLRKDVHCVDGFKWHCREPYSERKHKTKACNYSESLRKNTFFEKSKLTLFTVCAFVNLWALNASLSLIVVQLGISPNTAVDWASFCRQVVEQAFVANKQKIGGPGKTVEVDESKFGRRKHHRGHRVEGQWVFGGLERESGRCFLVPVKRCDAETIITIIKEWILPGTTIISDCLKVNFNIQNVGFKI